MYPLIGIPCRAGLRGEKNRPMYYANRAYAQAIEDAGGIPILIPIYKETETLAELLPIIDGVLLSGGIDIHPDAYNHKEHPALRETNKQLDSLELQLTTWALQQDIPMLGICRGLQMINVASGGTLYQDLASEYEGSLQHTSGDTLPNEIAHTVRIEPASQMEAVFGVREIAVNSLHHQAIRELGEGIVVSGRSKDGVVELIELPKQKFGLAVQCHPEELYVEHPGWSHLFTAFIEACQRNRESQRPKRETLASINA